MRGCLDGAGELWLGRDGSIFIGNALRDVEDMRCTQETTARDGTDRISKQRCHASQIQRKRTPALGMHAHSYES